MAKSDRGWMPEATDFEWIERTAGEPHPVLREMEAAARPELRASACDRPSAVRSAITLP